uniref:DNA-directed RNA polymerase n=1 Tax=Lobochlamys segnis TaxID=52035 RepID=A0A0S2IBV0_9CHLO|nr:beta subunit of RNA polymerase [Lobochlamys segnis]
MFINKQNRNPYVGLRSFTAACFIWGAAGNTSASCSCCIRYIRKCRSSPYFLACVSSLKCGVRSKPLSAPSPSPSSPALAGERSEPSPQGLRTLGLWHLLTLVQPGVLRWGFSKLPMRKGWEHFVCQNQNAHTQSFGWNYTDRTELSQHLSKAYFAKFSVSHLYAKAEESLSSMAPTEGLGAAPLLRKDSSGLFPIMKKFKPIEYSLETFHRSNQDTCLVHKPAVFEGDWVQSGDLLADCTASLGGELSLGHNILVAYMPWEGYNYEDAILINERLVFDDLYTSIHIEKYEIETRETKTGAEQITREIPDIDEKEVQHLDKNGIAKIGSWVEEGDILVGKITPINKKSLSPYQILLYKVLEKEIKLLKDSSLRAPKGIQSKVIKIHILNSEAAHHQTKSKIGKLIQKHIELNKHQVQENLDQRHFSKQLKSSKNLLNVKLRATTSKNSKLGVTHSVLLSDAPFLKKTKGYVPNILNQTKKQKEFPDQPREFQKVRGRPSRPFSIKKRHMSEQNSKFYNFKLLHRQRLGMGYIWLERKTIKLTTKETHLERFSILKTRFTCSLAKKLILTKKINQFLIHNKSLSKTLVNLLYQKSAIAQLSPTLYFSSNDDTAFQRATGRGGEQSSPARSEPQGLSLSRREEVQPGLPASPASFPGSLSPASSQREMRAGEAASLKLGKLGLLLTRRVRGGSRLASLTVKVRKGNAGLALAIDTTTVPEAEAKQGLVGAVRLSQNKETKSLKSFREATSKFNLNGQGRSNSKSSSSSSKKVSTKSIGNLSFNEAALTIHIYLAEKRKIQVGDKMAGRHGNKGIISQILPRQDMPYMPDGTPIDIVLNPLGVPSRMNVGQIYECLLGLAGRVLGEHFKIFPFDEIYGPEASRTFVYSKLYEARKKTGNKWLFDPDFPGKMRLYDGRTGDCYFQPVMVGRAYMLKLVHMVDDKIHCLTPDHDVLTNVGWLPIDQVCLYHKVATLNTVGELSYQNPNNIFYYPNYKGSLYYIKNKNIDLAVTLNHRMYVSFLNRPNFKDYQLIEAQDLLGKQPQYLKTANWNKKPYQFVLPSVFSTLGFIPSSPVNMNAWLTLFGLWVAQGEVVSVEKNSINSKISSSREGGYFCQNSHFDSSLWATAFPSLLSFPSLASLTVKAANAREAAFRLSEARLSLSPASSQRETRAGEEVQPAKPVALTFMGRDEALAGSPVAPAGCTHHKGECYRLRFFPKGKTIKVSATGETLKLSLSPASSQRETRASPEGLEEVQPEKRSCGIPVNAARVSMRTRKNKEKEGKSKIRVLTPARSEAGLGAPPIITSASARNKDKKIMYQVQIACNKPSLVLALTAAVTALGYSSRMTDNKLNIFNEQLYAYLRPLSVGAVNKSLPPWVWDLDKTQAQILLNALCLADDQFDWGDISFSYHTSSIKLADDVMRLALHAGWSANKYLYLPKGNSLIINNKEITANDDLWRVSIIKDNPAVADKELLLLPAINNDPFFTEGRSLSFAQNKEQNAQVEEVLPYEGPVCCLSVPNQVFYVRRNGIPAWTGNSRSTGPYSLVTQQPLRGRSKIGGQRLGEMEVWAIEGYGAAFTLLEMLTIKSDDMTGRMTLWSNILLNKEISIGTPEAFKVLITELQSLCLDIGLFRYESSEKVSDMESLGEFVHSQSKDSIVSETDNKKTKPASLEVQLKETLPTKDPLNLEIKSIKESSLSTLEKDFSISNLYRFRGLKRLNQNLKQIENLRELP